jgi:hypothetical protein
MALTQTQIDNKIALLNAELAENGVKIANALKKGCEPCESLFIESIKMRFELFVLNELSDSMTWLITNTGLNILTNTNAKIITT